MSADKENKKFDLFELLTALLLGVTAVGAALASLQSDQWSGKQLDAFAEANTVTTKAAAQYNEDIVWVNADYTFVAQAKQQILEARDSDDPRAKERHFEIASYLYANQLTETGYKAMELPLDFYVEDEDQANAAKPDTKTEQPVAKTDEPSADEDDDEDKETPNTTASTAPKIEKDIPNEALLESLHVELDDEYVDIMLRDGEAMFKQADEKFKEGRIANEIGDSFSLVGVYYTVALFLVGLGLVFKSQIRWSFLGFGAVVFVGSTIFMLTLSWA